MHFSNLEFVSVSNGYQTTCVTASGGQMHHTIGRLRALKIFILINEATRSILKVKFAKRSILK